MAIHRKWGGSHSGWLYARRPATHSPKLLPPRRRLGRGEQTGQSNSWAAAPGCTRYVLPSSPVLTPGLVLLDTYGSGPYVLRQLFAQTSGLLDTP